MNLAPDDAIELGQLLQFLDDWLAANRDPISKPLNCFVGCEAYGTQSLRDDLARFTFLLGESDGEDIFLPGNPAERTHRDSNPDGH